MKTIKIKIAPTSEQVAIIDSYLEELSWLWNKLLASEMNNHCLSWYDWAAKQVAKKRWPAFSLDGIRLVPLRFGRSAYHGAACEIARGGAYWKRDDAVNIPVKIKGKVEYRKGLKRVEGDRPYELIAVADHQPYQFQDGTPLNAPGDWDRIGKLNALRLAEGRSLLSIHSDYVGGLIKQFEAAWQAWLDPNQPKRLKLKFKNKENGFVGSLFNGQTPPHLDFDAGFIKIPGCEPIAITDRSWAQRIPPDSVPRSYTLNRRPSGFYINVVFASSLQPALTKMKRLAGALKKQYGSDSPEHLAAKEQILQTQTAIADAAKVDRKPLCVGVDPGVNAIVATDHGALFCPNLSRERVSIKIEYLQAKLDEVEACNDRQWKSSGNTGARPATKNEIKLKQKIARAHERGANSGNAFNHKLSTRLARTYTSIAWEDTQLSNLLKQCQPKACEEGTGYLPNGAAAKRGLNWSLSQRCLGDLKAKTKSKLAAMGGLFVEPPAAHSSRCCAVCGEQGDRQSQYLFVCLNESCIDYHKPQQADVNAARNHAQNAGFELAAVVHRQDRLSYTRSIRRKFNISKNTLEFCRDRSLGGSLRLETMTCKEQSPEVRETATTLADEPEQWLTIFEKELGQLLEDPFRD